MTKHIIINADDFGLTKGVTDGILYSHINGIVQSTTLMMNGLATEYAVECAKKHPTLKTGVHLVLSWGKPLASNATSLIDANGHFRFTSSFQHMEPPHPDEVLKEWHAQIDAFLHSGLPLHHIDSHHHIHGWSFLQEVVINIAEHYNVPIRYTHTLSHRKDLCLTESLYSGFYLSGVNHHLFHELDQINASTIEVMTHPAFIDQDLHKNSSYVEHRAKELEILTSLEKPAHFNWLIS